jgi:membrane fusion protein (multidrug efflux system)
MKNFKLFRWQTILAAVILLAASGTVYALRHTARATPIATQPTPPTVTVAHPTRKTVEVQSEWVGQMDSPQTVELRARVEGFVKEINFEEGAEVQKGALLFVIDPQPFEVARQKAQGELRAAETALVQAKDIKQIEVNRANVERSKATLANARQVAKDYTNALAVDAVNRQQLDAAVTTAKEAEATVAANQAALSQAEADYQHNISKAESSVAVAQAALAEANLNLGYTRMYAPTTGRIGRAEVKIGAFVGKGEPTLLATMSQIDPIWVYFAVSEREAFELHTLATENKLGRDESGALPLNMVLENGTVYPAEGKLNYTARTVDAGTGTLTFRAEFPNPEGFLRPGNYAKIRAVVTERPNALLVSERALGADQAGKYLLVVNSENKVERRTVSIGPRTEGNVVIEKGLIDGEQVVVNGLQRARPGASVTPVLETASTAARTAASGHDVVSAK